MQFKLNITCDNAAFGDSVSEEHSPQTAQPELIRLLIHAAQAVENGHTSGKLYDINGNAVGTWEFTGYDGE